LTGKIREYLLESQEIIFEYNKNKAFLIKTTTTDSVENIISTLHLQSSRLKSIILIFGGASGNIDTSESSTTMLFQILDNVLKYASDNDAIIIDGGTKSGIMEIVGQRASIIDLAKKPIILGVAPEGLISLTKSIKKEDKDDDKDDKVLLDPNHSHFVLVEGHRWGDETIKLFEIASILAENNGIPIVALLAGGGEISKKEILFCINKSWPIIVIEKTGYLADEIASFKNQKQSFEKMSTPEDVDMEMIISYPALKLLSVYSNQKELFEQFFSMF
jgi:hypothetical protein